MTSQPWMRGLELVTTLPAVTLQWSHDLSAMDAWMTPYWTLPNPLLQWSHDLSAMDACRPPCPCRPACWRFNGAMTSQPWMLGIFSMAATPRVWLQWSHDLSAMDARGVVADVAQWRQLQWSHDLSAMDAGPKALPANQTCPASMEP